LNSDGLRLAWCSHEAAKYAVEHWHYSRRMPAPPYARIGVWERGRFIGVVLFSRGANRDLLRPYGLSGVEGCELSRVALTEHEAPVSRIVTVAVRLLKAASPGLRLVVSFADPEQEHVGVIYQAMGWTYTGQTAPDRAWVNGQTGRRYHSRLVSENGSGYRRQFGILKPSVDSRGLLKVRTAGKHRYLWSLDAETRARIAPLAKPYPKRAGSIEADAPATHAGEGGVAPTPALQTPHGNRPRWSLGAAEQRQGFPALSVPGSLP